MTERINGWMMVLRLVLPVMVTSMLFMLSDIRTDQRGIRVDVSNLRDNLHHEMVEIKERMAVVETLLRYPGER